MREGFDAAADPCRVALQDRPTLRECVVPLHDPFERLGLHHQYEADVRTLIGDDEPFLQLFGVLEDQAGSFGMLQAIMQLFGAAGGVHTDRDGARTLDREVTDEPFRAVLPEQGDPVAGIDALLAQPGREFLDCSRVLAPAALAPQTEPLAPVRVAAIFATTVAQRWHSAQR